MTRKGVFAQIEKKRWAHGDANRQDSGNWQPEIAHLRWESKMPPHRRRGPQPPWAEDAAADRRP
jgi:hypothetical protein